ncbi:hypothetical protein [Paraburkholderia kururiensis]|uniref:Uncharacterized protein n=1 Tax=Paraburkholderia kururiensis TaxID=984307 RepID=A0ABZ0WQ59_9BURK|nr:hypothetical protein [Paraburkholderia kururiensis]WQD79544.1 hypothetical protein U0042_07590 [Paraburkholderia kururiensis]
MRDNIAVLKRSTLATFLCLALLAGRAAAEQTREPPGPVMMVHFDYYPKDRARIHALEQRLATAIKRAGAGELGETELHADGNDGYLYLYGPDADRLYAVTRPILRSSPLMAGAEVTTHYGARAQTFGLNDHRAP